MKFNYKTNEQQTSITMNYKKHIYLIVLVTLTAFRVTKAQTNPHLLPQYDFVQYDSNYIHFYSDSANFNTFYGKLDTLIAKGKGKINIMQIGGSHIQADIWSDQLRKNFQQLSPNLNGGRGFLFPYKLAKTNNPYYYEVSYTGEWAGYRNSVSKHHATWGISGITASTTDSVVSFKINFRGENTPYYDFKRIKIFHNIDSASTYCIELISDTAIAIKTNYAVGYTVFELANYSDKLEFIIYKTDTSKAQFDLYGLSIENDDPGIVYNSIGVNGASTSSYLRCQLFKQHLQAIPPDLVIFCIGINDAYDPSFCKLCYENNYDTLVSWIKEINPKTNFLFVTNNDSYYNKKYPNKRAEIAREVMITLATKHNAAMWDMYSVMGGLGSIKTWQKNNLAKTDKVHLTTEGYKLMGDLQFSALMKNFATYYKTNSTN